MKRMLCGVCVLLALLVLGGCRMEQDAVLHLQKNGSGTLTVTEVVYEDPEANANNEPDAAPDEEDFRKEAGKYGEGLTPVSIKAAKTKDGGIRTERVYRFADINKVKLGDNLSMHDPVFTYAAGTLHIKMKKVTAEDADKMQSDLRGMQEAKAEEKQDQDVLLRFTLTFEGGVKKTDATYPPAPGIVLVDIDGGKLLQSPEAMKRYAGIRVTDAEAMKAAAKEFPFFLLECKENVTVEF